MRMSKSMVGLVTLSFGLLLVSCSPNQSEAVFSPSPSRISIVKISDPPCQPLKDQVKELEQLALLAHSDAIDLERKMLMARVRNLAASGLITVGGMREFTRLQSLEKMQAARLRLPVPNSKPEIAKFTEATRNAMDATFNQQRKVDDLITVFFYHGYLKPYLFPEVVQLGLHRLSIANEGVRIMTTNPKCFTDIELFVAKLLRDDTKGLHGSWTSKQTAENLRDFL